MRFLIVFIIPFVVACNAQQMPNKTSEVKTAQEALSKVLFQGKTELEFVEKSEDVWQSELSEMAFYVIREKGTERAFTGQYWDNKEAGLYTCAACGLALFDSKTKYKSGTGWPSYYEPLHESYIREDTDYHLGYARTEVMCNRCGGHLGHVFPDGPDPTGLRYCINSVSLDFIPEEKREAYLKEYK